MLNASSKYTDLRGLGSTCHTKPATGRENVRFDHKSLFLLLLFFLCCCFVLFFLAFHSSFLLFHLLASLSFSSEKINEEERGVEYLT